jgi:hypothetical protein
MDGQNTSQATINETRTKWCASNKKIGFTPTTLVLLGITAIVAIILIKNDK